MNKNIFEVTYLAESFFQIKKKVISAVSGFKGFKNYTEKSLES